LAVASPQANPIKRCERVAIHVEIGCAENATSHSLAQCGKTVLSTHAPDHAFACASAVSLLHGGRLIATGPPRSVLSPARLEAVYGLPVAVEHLAGGHTVCVPDLSVPS